MYANQLNSFNKLKESRYFIGYRGSSGDKLFPLDSSEVYDATIIWDINDMSVEGYILFQDTMKIMEVLPPHSSMFLQFKITDLAGNKFQHSFVVTKISKELQNVNNTIIKIEFIDEYYFMMSNMYLSKGFKNIKFSKVLKETLENKQHTKGNIFQPKPCNFSNTKQEYESLLLPGNKSLISFVYHRELLDSCLFFQTRNNLVLINSNEIYSNSVKLSEGLKFVSEDMNTGSPFEIRGLKVLYMDKLNYNTFLPDSISYESSAIGKTITKHQINVFDSKKDIGDSSVLVQLNSTIGNKLSENSKNINKRIYDIKLNDGVIIEIDVSGLFIYNLLYTVSLNVYSSMEHIKKFMPYISGEYTITKIVDRLEKGFFTQRLTLSRPGYKKA